MVKKEDQQKIQSHVEWKIRHLPRYLKKNRQGTLGTVSETSKKNEEQWENPTNYCQLIL